MKSYSVIAIVAHAFLRFEFKTQLTVDSVRGHDILATSLFVRLYMLYVTIWYALILLKSLK